MDTTELILKFGWIGWKGGLEDPDSLINWLYTNYGIWIKETPLPNPNAYYLLLFSGEILCQYFGLKQRNKIVEEVLPDILKLWKCENGRLKGPSLENYEEPNTDWT